jgi:hypothetical protein
MPAVQSNPRLLSAFSFCTDPRIFRDLDQEVKALLYGFERRWSAKLKPRSDRERSRLMCIHLLDDTEFDESFRVMVSTRAGTKPGKST